MDTRLFCSGLLQLQPVINVKTLLIVSPFSPKQAGISGPYPAEYTAIRGFKPEVEKALPSILGKKWVKFCSGITAKYTLFDQYRELLLWYLYLLEVRQDFCLHNNLHTIPFINTKFIFYKKKSSKDIFKAGQQTFSHAFISNKHKTQRSSAAQ